MQYCKPSERALALLFKLQRFLVFAVLHTLSKGLGNIRTHIQLPKSAGSCSVLRPSARALMLMPSVCRFFENSVATVD